MIARALTLTLGVALAALLLTGCGDTDPTGPTALELPPLERQDGGLLPIGGTQP